MANSEQQFHGTPRFRIVSRLGARATSAVYKAVDETREGFIALRTLPPLGEDRGEALRQEFRLLRNIRQPGLVDLEEVDCADGTWFYTMELVEGLPLLPYVREPSQSEGLSQGPSGPLDEVRLRSALGQVTRALVALHDAERIHGNLDPDSIRVTEQGRVVLLHAALMPEWLTGTEAEMSVLRSLPYVAPERLEGAEPSAEADWYSLGALLFECLAGTAPFTQVGGAELVDAKYTIVPELPNRDQCADDLAQLCMDLLSIDPDARPADDEVMQRLQLRRQTTVRPSQTFSVVGEAPPFVGRKRELGLLAEAFERTRHGSVSTLCLYGEAGIGKRTLAAQLARRLRKEYPHLVHLTGRCYEHGPIAFRGVTELVDSLSRYLASQDASAVATLLPKDAALLPRVFESMNRVPLPEPSDVGRAQQPAAARRRAFVGLRKLLRDLSQRHPILVVLDDMQWADADAMQLLDELVRPPDPPDMLLLLLVSNEISDASRPMRHWLGRLEAQVTHMRLRELSKRASLELAERLLGGGDLNDEADAAAIAEHGAGHPLLIDTLCRHRILYDEVPAPDVPIAALLRARAAKLPEKTAHVLNLLCTSDVPLPASVLAEAAQMTPESAGRHIGTLRVLNLARTVRGNADLDNLAPYHPMVTRALRERWEARDKTLLNRSLAAAMGAWLDAPKDVLAAHWLEAGAQDRAGECLAEAADIAGRRLAFDGAVQLLQRAIAYGQGPLAERHTARTKLADAYANAGQGERAAQAYMEAAGEAEPGKALELERRAAHQLLRSGHIEEGLRIVEAVLGRMNVRMPRSQRAALFSLMIGRLKLALRGTRFKERDSTLVPPNEVVRTDILGSLSTAMGMVDNIRGADSQTRYLLAALELGDASRVARALALEAGYQALTRGPEQEGWLRTLDRAMTLAEHAKDPQARGLALSVQSTVTFLAGAWRDNVDISLEAERVLSNECTDVDWEIGNARVWRAISRFYLGELKNLSDRLNDQVREAHERGDHYTHTNLRIAIGYMPLLLANEPRRAASLLDDAIRGWSHSSYQMPHFFYLLGRAQIDIYRDRRGVYARVMDDWPDLLGSQLMRVSMVEHTVRHLRGRAALCEAAAYPNQREPLLRDAADCASALVEQRASYARGWGYGLRAGICAQEGDLTTAVRHLRRAEAEFYEADMGLYAAAARLQLGYLLGNLESQALMTRAREWFSSQGVRRPRTLANTLLPGLA